MQILQACLDTLLAIQNNPILLVSIICICAMLLAALALRVVLTVLESNK